MKLITILLLLTFTGSAFADPIDDWLKTEEAQKEAYYVTKGTLLCREIKTMKNLYNYLVVNNFTYNQALIKRSPCFPLPNYRFGRLIDTDGEFLLIEYRYNSKFTLKSWTHRGFISKWVNYKNRLVN